MMNFLNSAALIALVLLSTITLGSCQESQPGTPPSPTTKPQTPAAGATPPVMGAKVNVEMVTTLGTIVIELDREMAPVSVANFLAYVEARFYDGTIFHRVIPTFMIQGGGFSEKLDKKTQGMRPGIANEWQNGLKNLRGTIAMARLGGNPNSATCEFFINVVDNLRLSQPQPDGAGYAVFGHVTKGMDVVDEIRNTECTVNQKYPGGRVVPVTPVVIESVRVMTGAGAKPGAAPEAPAPKPKPEQPTSKPGG